MRMFESLNKKTLLKAFLTLQSQFAYQSSCGCRDRPIMAVATSSSDSVNGKYLGGEAKLLQGTL